MAWSPEGFYLFSLADTYVDPNFLDYHGSFPLSEAFQLHFTIESEGKRHHFAAFMIPKKNPSYPDGFEIRPELFRMDGVEPAEKIPVAGHVQKLEKSLPHIAIEAFFPAKWFGVEQLKPGMHFRANIGLVSYFREFSMTWPGNAGVGDATNPTEFREIVLQ